MTLPSSDGRTTAWAGSVSWKHRPLCDWLYGRPHRRTEHSSRLPPWAVAMPSAIDRPSPVPSPTSLVVKNGSNTRPRSSALMPGPVVGHLDRVRVLGGIGADGDRPGRIADRVFGVHHQVEDDLLDLLAVDEHRQHAGVQLELQRDVAQRELVLAQPRRGADDLIEVGRRRDPASSGGRRRAGCARSARRATLPAGRSRDRGAGRCRGALRSSARRSR